MRAEGQFFSLDSQPKLWHRRPLHSFLQELGNPTLRLHRPSCRSGSSSDFSGWIHEITMKGWSSIANKRSSVTPNSLHRKRSTCLLERLLLHKAVLAFCLFPCFSHEPGLSSLTQPWSKPSSETSSCWENGNDPRELHICVDDVHMTVVFRG